MDLIKYKSTFFVHIPNKETSHIYVLCFSNVVSMFLSLPFNYAFVLAPKPHLRNIIKHSKRGVHIQHNLISSKLLFYNLEINIWRLVCRLEPWNEYEISYQCLVNTLKFIPLASLENSFPIISKSMHYCFFV